MEIFQNGTNQRSAELVQSDKEWWLKTREERLANMPKHPTPTKEK